MNLPKLIAACSLGIATLGLLVWGYGAGARSNEAAATSSDAQLRQELQQLREELQRVRQHSALMERRLAALESRPAIASVTSKAIDEPAAERGADPSKPPAAETEDSQPKHVERVFQAELDDPHWNAESELGGRLRELTGPDSSIQDLDCRSSLCRVQTAHKNGEAYRAYVTAMTMPQPPGQRLWGGAMFNSSEDPSGSGAVRGTVYLVRVGHAMPAPRE